MSEENLLSLIRESKSQLAKAIITGNKERIKKSREELEELRNKWFKMSNVDSEPHYEGIDDVSNDVKTSTSESNSDADIDMESTGWENEDNHFNSRVNEKAKESNQKADNNNKVKEKASNEVADNNNEVNEKASNHVADNNIEVNKEKSNQAADNNINSEKEKKSKDPTSKRRQKRVCPLKGCKSQVIDLPRHLREVHNWERENARKATSRFRMRESFSSKVAETDKRRKWKDYHHHRKCPVAGCRSIVKRLSHHFKQVHKDIPKQSSEYRALLKEARKIRPWQEAKIKVKEDSEVESTQEEEGSSSSNNQSAGKKTVEEADSRSATSESDSESQIEGKGILDSFSSWLQTADGGRKPEKISKQHASQLDKMLTVIDPNKDVASLFNKKLIRDTFLKNHAEKHYKPDTIKSYLLSLRHFCSYLKSEQPDGVNVDGAGVERIEEKARLWSTSYKKDSQRRHLQKMDEDLSNLISPEMVAEFEESESARRAISYIGQLGGAHSLEINQGIYTLIRDYVLTEITIANAHRSGVLANMTLGEFRKAKKNGESFLISVRKHKTADTHGPARVVLSPTLYSYLKVYVNEVRSQVASSSSENDDVEGRAVFLSWNGSKLESGQISTAINAAWKKGGMAGHVSSTIFRKSAVTNVHENHKDMRSELADLMGHKETTAARFYRLHEKQGACVQAGSNLPSIMRVPQKTPASGNMKAPQKTPASGNSKSAHSSLKATKPRLSWKEEEVAAIKELFADEIKVKSVTMDVVRDKIKDHPILKHVETKRVCDRVRSEWRFGGKSDCELEEEVDGTSPIELPKVTECLSDKMSRFFSADVSASSSDIVVPSNTSFLSRNIFDEEDRKCLRKVCGSMVKGGVISKGAVKAALEKETYGKELLRKFTIPQLVNRLKYERRLNNRRGKET